MNRKRILIFLVAAAVLTATGLYAGWFRRDMALEGSGTVEEPRYTFRHTRSSRI